jgi:hypothetical protein
MLAFKGKVMEVRGSTIRVATNTSSKVLDAQWLELDPDYQETPELKTSYEGCHPEIAASLKRGEHIKCRVWDSLRETKRSEEIIAYAFGGAYPYRTYGEGYMYAEPIPKTETRVIGPVEMMKQLVERGYKQTTTTGSWVNNTEQSAFPPTMFTVCDKPPSKGSTIAEQYPWMLEEVEI